jgi:ribonuclease E
VPDWSDLWIAVQAGIWLGRSRPGDVIEIVSHDRAFDAVGDAAARLGVKFNRITYRIAGPSAERATEPSAERRGRRRRRRGGAGRGHAPAAAPHAAAPHAERVTPPATGAPAHEEPHAASQEQIQQVIARLAAADPAHTVTLDALTVALKAAGFQRPPGSPRLVTRLRRMKDVEVLPNGRVRMVTHHAPATTAAAEPLAEPTEAEDDAEAQDGETSAAAENGSAAETGAKRRSRRRGGRRRGGRGRKGAGAAPAAPSE